MDTVLRLGFMEGPKALLTAARVVFKRPRVLLWLIPPFLITLILDALAFYFAFAWVRTGIQNLVAGDGYAAWLRVFLDVLGGAAVLFVLGWSFAWLFLTLTSPFQDFISAEVERELRGQSGPEPAGFSGFMRSIFQSLLQAIVITLLTLLILLVGLIPLAGPVLVFVWGAFALGYSFVAIPSGRMAHRIQERLAFARRHRGAVFGLGSLVAIAAFIPVGNVLCMPLFVVAGTVLYVKGE